MNTITTVAATYTPPSTSVIHNAQVSLTDRSPASVVNLVQYDDMLPIVAVALRANNLPYTVPSGASVNVRMAKPDGTYVYNPALGVSENAQTAYIAVTLQMTAAFGKSTPTIEIVIDGNVAATGAFTVIIDENPVPESAVESTDEYLTIYQILQQVQASAKIVSDNEEGIQYIDNNQENISAVVANGKNIAAVGQSIDKVNAVGTNIADVQTAAQNIEAIQNAPTAAENAAASATLSESWAVGGTGTREGENTNNAKYWCNQAQTVAQGALGWYETEQALQAAYPTGQNGQWAIVGTTDTIWTWDSDTGAWVNTGSQIDMSNYYQKQEANARFQMPVGFIFEWVPVDGQSVDLSTPQKVASYFGYGTWAEFAPGKVLAAASSSHAVGTSVGSETHTMTLQELVSHEHSINGWSFGIQNPSGGETQFAPTEPYSSINNFSGTTKPTGEGQPFSIMQPTQYVYRWQRIA